LMSCLTQIEISGMAKTSLWEELVYLSTLKVMNIQYDIVENFLSKLTNLDRLTVDAPLFPTSLISNCKNLTSLQFLEFQSSCFGFSRQDLKDLMKHLIMTEIFYDKTSAKFDCVAPEYETDETEEESDLE
jgi:hypothetical protein